MRYSKSCRSNNPTSFNNSFCAAALYNSARYHLYIEEREIGIELLQQVRVRQNDQIPLDEMYWFWMNALLEDGEDIEPILRQAGRAVPEGPQVKALTLTFDSLGADDRRRSQALHDIALCAQRAYREGQSDIFTG